MNLNNKKKKTFHKITEKLFEIDGIPLVISPRFRELWNAIVFREDDRVNVLAPTQDGKSVTIASALTLVAATCDEEFLILAPQKKKAQIIMKYVNEFSVQHPMIRHQLEIDSKDKLDRLNRTRAKDHVTYKSGGSILTLTLDAKNKQKSKEAVMGFGGNNIIADEAGLIDDVLWATVKRMLGGDVKSSKQKKMLVKIGNPFYRNHFHTSSNSDRFKQIFHNYKDSIRDYENGFYGYTPEYIEEMRGEALFDVLYECEFPDESALDEKGYRRLLTSSEVTESQKDITFPYNDKERNKTWIKAGTPKLGIDIGAGGDPSVYILRWPTYSRVESVNNSSDTMVQVSETERIIDKYGIPHRDVFMDDLAVGRGVRDRCWERGLDIIGVSVGGKSNQPDKWANIRAELFMRARKWLLQDESMLEPYKKDYKDVWQQLNWIKYKTNSSKNIKIMKKEKIKEENRGQSPDFADSFSLTFYKAPSVGVIN